MIVKNIEAKSISYRQIVKHSRQGNVHEIMAYSHKSTGNGIKKLSKDFYVNTSAPLLNDSGELLRSLPDDFNPDYLFTDASGYSFIKQHYNFTENRSQSPNEIRKTFKRLRALINSNVTDPRKCKFITLTYRDNMTDCERLRHDLSLFIKRFKYYIERLTNNKGNCLGLTFEYISVFEPQERGAWHAHIIFIFNKQIRFIDNCEVSRIWSHGFTTTRRVDNCDNIGAYLTAYLADIEVSDSVDSRSLEFLKSSQSAISIKECSVPSYDHAGNPEAKQKKKFIKGGRLYLYPKGFHLYRCSKGVKRPEVVYHTYQDVLNELGCDASLTFHKTIHISDGNNFENTLTYMFYNIKRKVNRVDARTSENEILRCAADFSKSRAYSSPVVYSFSDSGCDLADKNTADILKYISENQFNMRC